MGALRGRMGRGECGDSAVGNNFTKNSSSNIKILNYRLRRRHRRYNIETTEAVVGATQLNVCVLSFRGSLIRILLLEIIAHG